MNDGERERKRKIIPCPQPHTALLSMLRGQSGDEITTKTREGRGGGYGHENTMTRHKGK